MTNDNDIIDFYLNKYNLKDILTKRQLKKLAAKGINL